MCNDLQGIPMSHQQPMLHNIHKYIRKDPERDFFEDTIQYRILKYEFIEK